MPFIPSDYTESKTLMRNNLDLHLELKFFFYSFTELNYGAKCQIAKSIRLPILIQVEVKKPQHV